ncbi:MAG: glucoamylase family protein [Elusimicrobiota bacterium]
MQARRWGLAFLLSLAAPAARAAGTAPSAPPLTREDEAFLDDLQRRSLSFFLEQTDLRTGLTRDRARADGSTYTSDRGKVASSAATGFMLSALCVGEARGWLAKDAARDQARRTLEFYVGRSTHVGGWYYHFVDPGTGERRWNSEVSTIDTALLLAGVLTVRQCFKDDPEIVRLATELYARVDYPAMLAGDPALLSMGYHPETGFISDRWNRYCEHPILTLVGIGAPGRALTPKAWSAWKRNWKEYGGFRYLDHKDTSLFMHQYPQAWLDLRAWREKGKRPVDYFDNSVKATLAHRRFCLEELGKEFPKSYGGAVWGVTASDASEERYIAWGGPPRESHIDGSVVPCAPGGSLMFTPRASLDALRAMKAKYGEKVYRRYGFVDAFNPTTGWFDADVIGIDVGITLLSAENLRTGRVWGWFMANPEIEKGLRLAGFEKT